MPLICLGGAERRGGGEACGDREAPHYPQGAGIDITPQGVAANAYITVRCLAGCPADDPSASKVYWAVYRGATLQFPRDFTDPGPGNVGGNAVLDRAPRYNSTWSVKVEGLPVSREFNVWLYDAYLDANLTIRPGALHQVRSTGFEPGGDVTWRMERKNAETGRYEIFGGGTTRAASVGANPGRVELTLQLPRGEAKNIAACGHARFDCYRVTVSGAGKSTEVVNVQVDVANITRSIATTPPQTGVIELQRTRNATGEIDLYYPGGRLAYGPKFVEGDAPENVALRARALRAAVEKYWPVNDTAIQIDEVPLVYDPGRFLWRAQWTIPKDMALVQGQMYRLRLLEQRDAHGNRVAEDVLRSFTVARAEVAPMIADYWRELERTEEGILRLSIRYHNGSAFSVADAPEGNSSPLRGCYVYLPPPPPEPTPPPPRVDSCTNRNLTWGTYHDGAWNFSVRFPRTYEDLGEHRFILVNGTTDRWGNRIFGLTTPSFAVLPAQPTVQFSTVARGQETEVLERGNRIFVSATIRYHDGSPYNHAVRVNPNSEEARVLNGSLLRRGPAPNGGYGPLASEARFDLVETDASSGRWSGYLQLTDDDTSTPVGIWTFRHAFEDNVTVPNGNLSSFDRRIVSSVIQVCPTFQPGARLPTGAVQKFRFSLYYSECGTGREVPLASIQSQVSVRVYGYDPQAQATRGEPLSNAIIPTYSEQTRDWGIDYEIPNELFAGTFVFVVQGADAFGNRIHEGARSRAFTTFTEIILRTVVANPPAEVLRGDSATVIFDARPGDVGVDPNSVPRIQLERFDTSSRECPRGAEEGGCWVRERGDVRMPDPTLEDHVGVFPVGIDTPVGIYRFSLQGRDASFRIITGVSGNFTVNPTVVTRALLTPPPEQTVKGAPFSFYVEQMHGDKVNERVIFFNGRPIVMPAPVVSYDAGRMNVTWAVPFEAPTGNYTLRLSGRDVNGNVITVITPPIEATAASLVGRLLGQPTRVVARGDEARVLFGVSYPDGGFYAATDTPRVYVRDASSVTIAEATVRREGLTFAAFWIPRPDTPIGEYSFEVSSAATGGTGNLFPPLQSQVFRVVPGTVGRPPADDAPAQTARMQSFTFTVPAELDDRYVAFEVVYYGPSLSTITDTTATLPEVARTPIAHTLDAPARKYLVTYATTHQSQTGSFVIAMSGEDAEGNALTAQSRRFFITPVTIGVTYDPWPADDAFGEGKTIVLSFTARYGVGELLDDTYGRPSAVVLYNNQPVTQRPELEYRDGRWFLTWTAPEILPPGDYTFAIGGTDTSGNPIANARSKSYIVSAGSLPASFLKTVPDAELPLVLIGLAALALVLGRRRGK